MKIESQLQLNKLWLIFNSMIMLQDQKFNSSLSYMNVKEEGPVGHFECSADSDKLQNLKYHKQITNNDNKWLNKLLH